MACSWCYHVVKWLCEYKISKRGDKMVLVLVVFFEVLFGVSVLAIYERLEILDE